jgi:cytochrome c oxidase subunit III
MATMVQRSPVNPARTGVWVGIAAITMMFAAFTGAMIVRQAEADWSHFRVPAILYFNTVLLMASSWTLERARGRLVVAGDVGSLEARQGRRWLAFTLALGVLFVAGQVVAWRQLAALGLFLATNPSSAFFYLLTAIHGTHVLGGVAALIYVLRRVHRPDGGQALGAMRAAAVYWHFLTALWLYLLLLLTLRL